MLSIISDLSNNSIENDYVKSTSLAHRKKFAQFFTPFPVADLMARWLVGNANIKTVLEPAFGLGVFTRAIWFYKKNIIIKGFEIDETIFEYGSKYFHGLRNINLYLEDYMYNDWDQKYDGIICNPPYFKFHDYDNKSILQEIEKKLKLKLNGFTNLYTLFLLKSIHQLNQNGRCAYIIPSEFLNSDYGKLVKKYLLKSKVLRHIIVIDFEENVFKDVLTTASIILCANDNLTEKIQFSNVKSLRDLSQVVDLIADYPTFSDRKQLYNLSELNPQIKWKAYYQKQNCIKFKNLVPFSTYARVVRGIATGSNKYFVFNQSKAHLFSIKEEGFLPCICRASDVKKAFFMPADFEELKSKDKNVFLLNAVNSNDSSVINYLKIGEIDGVDKGFLTASRNPWYSLENRPPAPIWVSVFNRTGLRFIRNETSLLNLTAFHCIYPKQTSLFSEVNVDLLFAYLLTDTARQIFEDNSREYGNGLQKFEPNDINKGQMLNLDILEDEQKKLILNLYWKYRIEVIENNGGESVLSEINQIFVRNYA